jgi:hypothetical protein
MPIIPNAVTGGQLPAKVVPMSEFDHDPSANTGRFRAFAERSDEDIRRRSRRTSPALLVVVGVIVLAVVIVVVAMA